MLSCRWFVLIYLHVSGHPTTDVILSQQHSLPSSRQGTHFEPERAWTHHRTQRTTVSAAPGGLCGQPKSTGADRQSQGGPEDSYSKKDNQSSFSVASYGVFSIYVQNKNVSSAPKETTWVLYLVERMLIHLTRDFRFKWLQVMPPMGGYQDLSRFTRA